LSIYILVDRISKIVWDGGQKKIQEKVNYRKYKNGRSIIVVVILTGSANKFKG